MTMTPTPNPLEKIAELEKEIKSLTRLVREAAAREKLMATRLANLAKDHAATAKQLKELTVTTKKVDVKVDSVHSQVQRKKG